MTYRSLLVLLDQGPQCAARSQAAMRLAIVLDCHLIGGCPHRPAGACGVDCVTFRIRPRQG